MIKNCKQCGTEFSTGDKRKIFCSQSCSCTFNNILRGPRSQETKDKLSRIKKEYDKNHSSMIDITGIKTFGEYNGLDKIKIMYRKDIIRPCSFCGDDFASSGRRITCSDKCKKKLRLRSSSENNNKKPSGGLREGSGRGKSGWYKGYFCSSTYELAYLIYHLDHSIPIERYKGYFEYYDPDRQGYFKYYPDFLVDGTIIEIKGYKTKLNDYKLSGVPPHIKIKILYKNDLTEIFQYVTIKEKLAPSAFYLLYEDVKKLEKQCAGCDSLFYVTRERKKFCSKECSCRFLGRRPKKLA